MPFHLDYFARKYPVLFHLTARENLELIQASMRLQSAATLMSAAGDTSLLRARRLESHRLEKDGRTVAVLRDQRPLHRGHAGLNGDWTFEDLVESLNTRVFLWRGSAQRPHDQGLRHFASYRDEKPVVLCISTSALVERNEPPEFCRYNSGSPRTSGGRKSPRGPDTFVRAEEAPFTAGKVVEVTFRNEVELPRDGYEVRPVASFLQG